MNIFAVEKKKTKFRAFGCEIPDSVESRAYFAILCHLSAEKFFAREKTSKKEDAVVATATTTRWMCVSSGIMLGDDRATDKMSRRQRNYVEKREGRENKGG